MTTTTHTPRRDHALRDRLMAALADKFTETGNPCQPMRVPCPPSDGGPNFPGVPDTREATPADVVDAVLAQLDTDPEPADVSPSTGAAIALSPAAPGWTVTTESPRSGDTVEAPIVAWASVADEPGAPFPTTIEPVFVVDGDTWTAGVHRDIFGGYPHINPPASASSGSPVGAREDGAQ